MKIQTLSTVLLAVMLAAPVTSPVFADEPLPAAPTVPALYQAACARADGLGWLRTDAVRSWATLSPEQQAAYACNHVSTMDGLGDAPRATLAYNLAACLSSLDGERAFLRLTRASDMCIEHLARVASK